VKGHNGGFCHLNAGDKGSLVLRKVGSIAAFARLIAILAAALMVSATMLSSASAETRTLRLYYVHTKERAEVTFKRNGKYLSDGLKKANHMLRDWRRNQPTKMDPKVLDLLWEVYKASGSRDYIHVVSAYRSPATNAMLRKTRGGQAEKSQHMVGKAIDFYLPDVKLSKLRGIALKYGAGGVGYYPRSGSPFVHIDTGRVRHWPRMNRKELLALFPKGDTLHVPTDGKPLPGYNQALAAYQAKGRSGAVYAGAGDADSVAKKPTLFAALFGGGEDQTEDEADSSAPAVAVAEAKPAEPKPAAKPKPQEVDIAALQPGALEGQPDGASSGVAAAAAPQAPERPVGAEEPIVLPEETPETPAFAELPRNGPAIAFAPRQPDPATQVPSPVDGELTEEGTLVASLPEGENVADIIASNLPDAGPLPLARPQAEQETVDVASVDPLAILTGETAAEPEQSALRTGFAPVPEPAPGRELVASLGGGNAQTDNERAALEPLTSETAIVKEPLAEIAAETPILENNSEAVETASLPDNGPVPQPRAKRAQQASTPVGDALDTGVRTTAKSGKTVVAKASGTKPRLKRVVPSAEAPTSDITPLPDSSNRFGPAGDDNASAGELAKTDNVKTASVAGSGKKAGRLKLPDGSELVSSGTLPVQN
jgi:uncharacterized protein YcbK (DUF882 family)